MIADLKYGIRQLIKRPAFTAIAVLILALGIGSNTAVFTVIDGLLLRGLPVSHPEQLVLVTSEYAVPYISYPMLNEFAQARSLAGVAAVSGSGRSMTVDGKSGAIPVLTNVVTGNYFSLLGVPAYLGRTLSPDDDRLDAPHQVAVLSYEFWQHQFGGDPSVLGKTVLIDHVELTIVGVAARGFNGVNAEVGADVCVPLQVDPLLNPGDEKGFHEPTASHHIWLHAFGRLRPGVKMSAAQAELDVLYKRELSRGGISAPALRDYGFQNHIVLQPGGSGFIANQHQLASLLNILLLVVGAVLVIACSNVASLLLARAAVRQREFALRAALGAARTRILRQLVVESLLLAGLAGMLGLALAHWGTLALVAYLPVASRNWTFDGRILWFSAAISVAAGIFVGLIPALRLTRLNPITALKSQASTLAGGSSQRLIRSLVAAQVALSLCLLAGAGLFARTLQNLKSVDLGFNPSGLLTSWIIFDSHYDLTQRAISSRELLAAVEQIPGVQAATFSWSGGGVMAGAGDTLRNFGVEGYVPRPGDPGFSAHAAYVGPNFFESLGIRILRGRAFNPAEIFPAKVIPDPNATPEVVINESLARRFFGTGDPVGHMLRLPDDNLAAAWGIKPTPYKIIGVARNTKEQSLRDNNELEIYLSCADIGRLPYPFPRGMNLVVRTSNNPASLSSAVQGAIHKSDPNLRFILSATVDESIDHEVFQERVVAQTVGLFSLFALALASLGLYGVLANNVAQRVREIGVRMALGADSGSIVSLILRQGLLLTAAGCVGGLAAAAGLVHLIASRLYGVPALDPTTFLFAVAVLFLVALLACWLPAWRATKIDPMIALRSE